jgi:hypothetical protein
VDDRRALEVGDWVRHTSKKGRETLGRITEREPSKLIKVRWLGGDRFYDIGNWPWELRRAKMTEWEIASWMEMELSR